MKRAVWAICLLLLAEKSFALEQTLTGFYYPTGKKVSAELGYGEFGNTYARKGRWHLGLDIRGKKEDDLIYAIADGKVVDISPNGWSDVGRQDNFAYLICHTLSGGKKFIAVYGHLKRQGQWPFGPFQKGDEVTTGEEIGRLGPLAGGKTGGPHLHFGVYQDRKDSNSCNQQAPYGYLPLPRPDGELVDRVLVYGNWFEPIAFIEKRSPKLKEGPDLPYEDYGACPGEGCVFGELVVLKDTPIYRDRDEQSAVVFVVKKGERVKAETGIAVTVVPGKIEVLRNTTLGRDYIPWRSQKTHYQFQKGDVLYLLTYLGEEFWKVWYRGESIELSFPIITRPGREGMEQESKDFSLVQENQSVWWIKIKNKKGEVGWTKEWQSFRSAQPGPLE